MHELFNHRPRLYQISVLLFKTFQMYSICINLSVCIIYNSRIEYIFYNLLSKTRKCLETSITNLDYIRYHFFFNTFKIYPIYINFSVCIVFNTRVEHISLAQCRMDASIMKHWYVLNLDLYIFSTIYLELAHTWIIKNLDYICHQNFFSTYQMYPNYMITSISMCVVSTYSVVSWHTMQNGCFFYYTALTCLRHPADTCTVNLSLSHIKGYICSEKLVHDEADSSSIRLCLDWILALPKHQL